jgi:hypothetical protein
MTMLKSMNACLSLVIVEAGRRHVRGGGRGLNPARE